MNLQFIDTTSRDGSQSLWALGIRSGMIEAVAESMDRAGLAVIEVPVTGPYKRFICDLKEDPSEMARVVAREMPNTVKSCMAGAVIDPFEAPPLSSIIEHFYRRLVEAGARNRAQLQCNTIDQIKRSMRRALPRFLADRKTHA